MCIPLNEIDALFSDSSPLWLKPLSYDWGSYQAHENWVKMWTKVGPSELLSANWTISSFRWRILSSAWMKTKLLVLKHLWWDYKTPCSPWETAHSCVHLPPAWSESTKKGKSGYMNYAKRIDTKIPFYIYMLFMQFMRTICLWIQHISTDNFYLLYSNPRPQSTSTRPTISLPTDEV